MPVKITEEMVMNYVANDVDLPKGIRVVNVKFDPRTRKLRACTLEKDGHPIRIGDWLLSDGRVVRFGAIEKR